MSKELRVIPIGGLGEFGMNMMALESGADMILVDAGTLFPGADRPGIDVIVPDISYVLENRAKVRGLVLTHAHQDHVGAVPHVLTQLDIPVYGTAFTLGLVRKQLSDSSSIPATSRSTRPRLTAGPSTSRSSPSTAGAG